MRRAIRQYGGTAALIVGLFAIAAVVAAWVLSNQGVRPPWAEGPFRLNAELSTAQSVMPGQGQSVQVSGVRVGLIASTRLRNGRAIVQLDLDPEYRDLVHTDATALLRPKTGLKDMLLEIDPGSRSAPLAEEGWTIPVANTQPDVNVDEILKMLDRDTRDYLQLLVSDLSRGLHGRGATLREVFRRYEPTTRDLARVSGSVAKRQVALRRLIHSLRLVSVEVASHDRELAALVSSSARVFRAFASEDDAVSQSLGRLPAALRTTRSALARVAVLADELPPTSRALGPVVRQLGPATRALGELGHRATGVVRDQLRPFVREARPISRSLNAPATNLARSAEPLRRAAVVLNHLLNMLAFNPDGREGPDDPNRDEGFLYWVGWGNHVAGALHATADANGPLRGLALAGPCSSFAGYADVIGQGNALLGSVLGGLQGVFTDPRVCGTASGQPAAVRRALARTGAR